MEQENLNMEKEPTSESECGSEAIDDVINRIGRSPTIMMFLVATCAMSCSMVGCYCAYMIKFTGFIPTDGWQCVSDTCNALKNSSADYSGAVVPQTFYELDTICENELAHEQDYVWITDRTTLAVEFDKICATQDLRLLDSLYFAGGTIGLVIGTFTFETLGRRRAGLLGGLICTVGTLLGALCHSYQFMVVIRLLQGLGNFLAYSGCYIWILEFVPQTMRIYYNSYTMLIWAFGYPGVVCISYFIRTWNYIHLGAAAIFVLCYIPFVLLPDSPRYLLSIGKVAEAKRVLESYSRFAGAQVSLAEVRLISGDEKKSESGKSTSFLTKISDFWHHKSMLLETCILAWLWFVCAILFYGLNYGWGSFGDTPYVNYLFAGLGEVIAYVALVPIIMFLGRRVGMSFTLAGATLCFLLGMIEWNWSDVWDIERLFSLVAIVMISAAFGLIFLYTGEIAPTTHRGFILCVCSIVARGASFMGPFASDVSDDRRVRLGLNAFLAGSAALLTFFLPETRKIAIPERASDVTARRRDQRLNTIACRRNSVMSAS